MVLNNKFDYKILKVTGLIIGKITPNQSLRTLALLAFRTKPERVQGPSPAILWTLSGRPESVPPPSNCAEPVVMRDSRGYHESERRPGNGVTHPMPGRREKP